MKLISITTIDIDDSGKGISASVSAYSPKCRPVISDPTLLSLQFSKQVKEHLKYLSGEHALVIFSTTKGKYFSMGVNPKSKSLKKKAGG